MKRITASLLLMIGVVLLFSACETEKIKIEDYGWKMRSVMHSEDGQLIVDASDEEFTAHPEAKQIDMTLVAKDGMITITDATNQKTYEGTYTVERITPKETHYKVEIDGKSGFATVAMTTYADGGAEATLPINLGDYALYFYEQ